jgi:hypothetical protein
MARGTLIASDFFWEDTVDQYLDPFQTADSREREELPFSIIGLGIGARGKIRAQRCYLIVSDRHSDAPEVSSSTGRRASWRRPDQ